MSAFDGISREGLIDMLEEATDELNHRWMHCTYCDWTHFYVVDDRDEAKRLAKEHALTCQSDPRVAELAALREQVQRLEAALKQTATQLHGVGIARITTNYHFGKDFHKCTNGWCMEAAAALDGAK